MLILENRRKSIEITKNEKGCELVTGRTLNKYGHATLKVNGISYFAHRLAYEQEFGKIPDGLIIRHKCDTPNCINTKHLELGTHADNVRDRVERNRSAKGEQNGRTKLTEEQARFIKYDSELSGNELARIFNVSRKTIYLIKKGENWSYL